LNITGLHNLTAARLSEFLALREVYRIDLSFAGGFGRSAEGYFTGGRWC